MRSSITNAMGKIWGRQKYGWRPLIPCLILLIILIFIPTGFEAGTIYKDCEKVSARVIDADDSTIRDMGLLRTGEQVCTVQIDSGIFAGRTASAANLLSGSLAQDKIFRAGDRAMVVVSHKDGEITSVTMVDHYRIGWEALLAGLFVLLLIVFAGPGGLRAILSFMITILCIWKVLVPGCLKGWNDILCAAVIVAVLTVVIIILVYGFDRRSLVSVAGSMLGVLTACVMGMIFTVAMNIHGAIMTDSESLIYSGYAGLDLTQIFMASIFLGASGAMMDLSVDITSGIHEVVRKKPDIGRWEAVGCGMRIGQAAMGTMTTTLLLAYAGSFIIQLMVFMAQGTPIINILNYKYIASEILQTLAGSFALVTVAPFTAIVGGLLLTDKKKITKSLPFSEK